MHGKWKMDNKKRKRKNGQRKRKRKTDSRRQLKTWNTLRAFMPRKALGDTTWNAKSESFAIFPKRKGRKRGDRARARELHTKCCLLPLSLFSFEFNVAWKLLSAAIFHFISPAISSIFLLYFFTLVFWIVFMRPRRQKAYAAKLP